MLLVSSAGMYALSVVCLLLHFCKANEDFFEVKKLMEIATMQLIEWSVTSPCGLPASAVQRAVPTWLHVIS